MKPNLLVTLANKNYIDQAKQLFSSVYFNAGWQGDYMLLSHEIPEEDLVWFRKKGILVKHCTSIKSVALPENFPIAHVSKFYLFTPEFKKWDNIVFLDADIIVRYSLEALTKISGFYATPDWIENHLLKNQFHFASLQDAPYQKFKKTFNENALVFNSGVMAFSTNIITEDSLGSLCNFLAQYHEFRALGLGDQPIFNLYFYGQWQKLSCVYNFFASIYIKFPFFGLKKTDAAVLHFFGVNKPWIPKSPFYKEWKMNLEKADLMDMRNVPYSRIFGRSRLVQTSLYLRVILVDFFFFPIDKRIILGESFLKERYPRLHSFLRKKIERFFGHFT